MGSIYGLGIMLLSSSNVAIGCEDIRNEFEPSLILTPLGKVGCIFPMVIWSITNSASGSVETSTVGEMQPTLVELDAKSSSFTRVGEIQ